MQIHKKQPVPVMICSGCGQAICAGELYQDVLGEQFCIACVLQHLKYAVQTDETTA